MSQIGPADLGQNTQKSRVLELANGQEHFTILYHINKAAGIFKTKLS